MRPQLKGLLFSLPGAWVANGHLPLARGQLPTYSVPMDEKDPLERVEGFLAASGMSPTALGAQAMGDSHFVFKLRAGRELRRKTRQRLLTWLSQREAA